MLISFDERNKKKNKGARERVFSLLTNARLSSSDSSLLDITRGLRLIAGVVE